MARPVVHTWLLRRPGGGAFVTVVDQIAGSDSACLLLTLFPALEAADRRQVRLLV